MIEILIQNYDKKGYRKDFYLFLHKCTIKIVQKDF